MAEYNGRQVVTRQPKGGRGLGPVPSEDIPSSIETSQSDIDYLGSQLCPPGMEYLINTNMIIVNQMMELLEILTGFDTPNKYEIMDGMGRRMYFAVETTDCCTRLCFGSQRPFEIVILNNAGQTVMKVKRELTCLFCCCAGCCGSTIQVYTGLGDNLIGQVKQACCDCCTSKYTVTDASGQASLDIQGPCCCCMCCEVTFNVYQNGQEIGAIQKKWGGIVKEAFTQADTFGVHFPMELDVRLKCLLIAAVFQIDFMYFENSQKNNNRRGRGYY